MLISGKITNNEKLIDFQKHSIKSNEEEVKIAQKRRFLSQTKEGFHRPLGIVSTDNMGWNRRFAVNEKVRSLSVIKMTNLQRS